VLGQQLWVEPARATTTRDSSHCSKRTFELKRQEAAQSVTVIKPYDALLDEYEPVRKTIE